MECANRCVLAYLGHAVQNTERISVEEALVNVCELDPRVLDSGYLELVGLLGPLLLGVQHDDSLEVLSRGAHPDALRVYEIGFDIDLFLSLEETEVEPYISKFNGISGSNLELLADILNEMGVMADAAQRNSYWDKALMIYHLCNSLDKTFSLDRERKISEINKRC